jgi:mitochondrial fission protein ELM1
VLTDGKAGDEQPCIGVAEALGVEAEIRRVNPRAPWSWLMPRGPVDPAEGPDVAGSPIAPPYPRLLLASGRRAVPYVRAVRQRAGREMFTVFLKDPRTGTGTADLIWAPDYDRLRGPNVLNTLTPPHRISAARLAAARAAPDPRLAALPGPRVAVLAGGNSRYVRFRRSDVARFAAALAALAGDGAALMMTASRRSPPALAAALRRLAADGCGFFWDGSGANPYVDMLALADAVVVTADSANMIGEATATGVPVLVFPLPGGHPKHRRYIRALARYGAVRDFTGRLESYTYPPLDSTPLVAAAIRRALSAAGMPLACRSSEVPR